MKKISLLLLLLIGNYFASIAQNTVTVSGKFVDQSGGGIMGLKVQLFTNVKTYPQIDCLPDGSFSYLVSDVKEDLLPSDYYISNSYPNPFNPKTRIDIYLPKKSFIKVSIYNIIAERIGEEISKFLDEGYNLIDLDLKGLPNGLYFASIEIDGKYSVTRKLILLYGIQHLASSVFHVNPELNHSLLDIKIDSIVVTGQSISKKVFTNFPDITNTSIDLGNLVINLPPPPPTINGTDNQTNVGTTTSIFWNYHYLATSYTLQVSVNNLFSSFVFNQSGITTTSQQITGLSNSTTYYWRVNGSNNYGTSPWSKTYSFTTIGLPGPRIISPPNNILNIYPIVRFLWAPESPAISYTFQVSTNNSFTNFIFNQSGLSNTELRIGNLSYSTTYYCRVNAATSNGVSDWSSVLSFTTKAQLPCPGAASVNYSGKIYYTVQIGNQCWLSENLDVGTMVQVNQNQNNNGAIEKYCINNDPNNCTLYGGLYQWNEAMQYAEAQGSRGICPVGWHIPTKAEIQTLSSYVNGNSNSLVAVGEGVALSAGTNTSGFSALLAGYRSNNLDFQFFYAKGLFWSSSEYGLGQTNAFQLSPPENINVMPVMESFGCSIRCIKD